MAWQTMIRVMAVVVVLAAGGAARSEQTMKRYARFAVGGRVVYGVVEGERIRELDGDLFADPQPTDRTHSPAEVRLLAPTIPTKVFGAAANFRDPANPPKVDAKPQLFFKSPASIIGPGEAIVMPADPNAGVLHESEVVAVIGRRCSKVTAEEAGAYVFGVTVGNDVTASNWNAADVTWWRGKGSDTFGPCGPYIVTGLDYNNLSTRCSVNGEQKTEGSMTQMVFGIDELVSFISQHMTLEPGDLIYSGASGATPAKVGDTVTVEIVGVMRLSNPVAGPAGK